MTRVTRDDRRSVLVSLIVVVLISLLLEVLVCNVNHWKTLGGPGEQTLSGDPVVFQDESSTVTFSDLDTPVKSISMHFPDGQPDILVTASYSITDDGDSSGYSLPDTELLPENERSQVYAVHPYGNVHSLSIHVQADSWPVTVSSVVVNETVPFVFIPVRFLMFLIVGFSIVLLRPKGILGKLPARENRTSLVVAACELVFAVLLISGTAFLGSNDVGSKWYHYYAFDEYTELAHSLSEGHLYLDEEPPQWLQEMDNPYDPGARDQLLEETGEGYKVDAAYHDGHYYVYFGIVPEVMFYLPYYQLTGMDLPDSHVVLIASIASICGLWFLLRKLIDHRFSHVNLSTFTLAFIALILGSGVIIALGRPSLYLVPATCALAFAVWGMALWFLAWCSGKQRYLWAGSLCIALIAGCRPQMLVLLAFSIPLLYRCITKDRPLGIKARGVVALVVPFVAVAIPILAYNAARFGSPLDFGASYNLAANDMRLRGFDPVRMLEGVFYYLFQVPGVTSSFPFLQMTDLEATFGGMTISEQLIGGLFVTQPWLLAILVLFPRKGDAIARGKAGAAATCGKGVLKKDPGRDADSTKASTAGPAASERIPAAARNLRITVVALVAMALVVCCFDTEAAGVLPRYLIDFGIFFSVAAILCILDATERSDTETLHRAFALLVTIGLVLAMFQRLAMGGPDSNPTGIYFGDSAWERARLLFEFWA